MGFFVAASVLCVGRQRRLFLFIAAMSTDQSASTPNTASTRPAGEKCINLALQGGGSHGAFTWGVLDRLLEETRLSFEGITATSAGAFNAVALADGLAAGGREGARNLRALAVGQSRSGSRPQAFARLLVDGVADVFCFAISNESVQY